VQKDKYYTSNNNSTSFTENAFDQEEKRIISTKALAMDVLIVNEALEEIKPQSSRHKISRP
jgi:hypothetical protein